MVKTTLLSAVYLTKKEYESASIFEAKSVMLPGNAKSLDNAFVCYSGNAAFNRKALSVMSKKYETDVSAYAYEIVAITNSKATYIHEEDILSSNVLHLGYCSKSIIEELARIAVDHNVPDIQSCWEIKAGKSKLDLGLFYQWFAEHPEIMNIAREHPWFEGIKLYKCPYTGDGISTVIAYLSDKNLLDMDEYGLVFTKLNFTKKVVMLFPVFGDKRPE